MNPPVIQFRTNVNEKDVDIVRTIVASTGFFYDFEIPVAVELVEDRLAGGENSSYHFIFAEVDGKTVAFSCFGSIACTEGGYDLYWIVTHDDYRGSGIGKVLLEETHQRVKNLGGRYLIAETSSLEKYSPTRYFYEKNNYKQEALIPDFYKEGDGKVIFVKRFM